MTPEENVVRLEELAVGHDVNRLPTTDALVGRTLSIAAPDGGISRYEFTDASSVVWSEGGEEGSARYEAVEVAGGVLYIDLVSGPGKWEWGAVTLIVSERTRRTLTIVSIIGQGDDGEPGEGRLSFKAGVLVEQPAEGQSAPAPFGEEPAPTRDLVGRRILYDYGPDHLFEHVYLNSERYAWQGLRGRWRSPGGSDPATMWRFDVGQYVFAFREVGTSVFFYNFDTLRSTGRFFGRTTEGTPLSVPVGAHIIPMGSVCYPDGVTPV